MFCPWGGLFVVWWGVSVLSVGSFVSGLVGGGGGGGG